MKAWLKGGLIGAGIGLILTIVMYIAEFIFNINLVNIFLPIFITAWAFCGENNIDCAWRVILISSIIYSFLLGIFIGWIVSKVKKKSK